MAQRARCPQLYAKHYVDKSDERTDLFRQLANRYDIRNALYPGSFVDISPSFTISEVAYVDNFRTTPRFFADPSVLVYIDSHKEYCGEPEVRFHHADYCGEFGETSMSFDLLISLYAGFVSPACKRYLRIGGVLVANDSHGDASMAYLDPDLDFIAAVRRRGNRFTISERGPERFFIPKKAVEITPSGLRETGRGVAYTKWTSAYVFRKVA